jgi:hypothetical protein
VRSFKSPQPLFVKEGFIKNAPFSKGAEGAGVLLQHRGDLLVQIKPETSTLQPPHDTRKPY